MEFVNFLPYSHEMTCRCADGFSGERCESSYQDIVHRSVINSILTDTVKLTTFQSIQNTLEDTQMFMRVSLTSIYESISKMESTIKEKITTLGESMSARFDWLSLSIKYRQSLEDLKYYQSLTNKTIYVTSTSIEINERMAVAYDTEIGKKKKGNVC